MRQLPQIWTISHVVWSGDIYHPYKKRGENPQEK